MIVDVGLIHDPDKEFQYSKLSSHILGIILSRAYDTDLKLFETENLYDPLEMKAGEWTLHLEDFYGGNRPSPKDNGYGKIRSYLS